MKSAKKSLEDLVKMIESGKKIEWVRKTQLIVQEDGTCLRRTICRDGAEELEEVLSSDRSIALVARARTGFSQIQFAGLLGISVRTLHDWEHGVHNRQVQQKRFLKSLLNAPMYLKR